MGFIRVIEMRVWQPKSHINGTKWSIRERGREGEAVDKKNREEGEKIEGEKEEKCKEFW